MKAPNDAAKTAAIKTGRIQRMSRWLAYMTEKEIKIDCDITPNALKITIQDDGKPFDINVVATPDIDVPLAEREVGGLGIYLINNLMDDVQHKALGENGNLLILKKKLDPTAGTPRSHN